MSGGHTSIMLSTEDRAVFDELKAEFGISIAQGCKVGARLYLKRLRMDDKVARYSEMYLENLITKPGRTRHEYGK